MGRYMHDPHKNWTRRIDDRDKGENMIAVLQHAGGDELFLESQCFSEVTRCMHTRPNDQARPEPCISVQSLHPAMCTRPNQAKGAVAFLADSTHGGRSRSRRMDNNHRDDWRHTGESIGSPRHRRAVDYVDYTRRTSWPCLPTCPLPALSTRSASERRVSEPCAVPCACPLGLADLLQVGGLDLTGGLDCLLLAG